MIGVTTNDQSVAIWENSHHLCDEVLTELRSNEVREILTTIDTRMKAEEELKQTAMIA